jgi:hypothetical protein
MLFFLCWLLKAEETWLLEGKTTDAKIVSDDREFFCITGDDLEVWSQIPCSSNNQCLSPLASREINVNQTEASI